MLTIGVTGSIGTGKSFITSCFARLGFPVFSADKCVHRLMQKNTHVIAEIAQAFPTAIIKNQISRNKLRELVKGKPKEFKKLEAILHPIVREEEQRFVQKCKRMRCKLAVLDIPLLFETGAEVLCDKVIVTYVSEKIQKVRVLKRGKMGEEFLEYIKKLQMDQLEKCEQADLVIDTGRSKAYNFKVVKNVAKDLITKHERI